MNPANTGFFPSHGIDLARKRKEMIEFQVAELSNRYTISADWLRDVLTNTAFDSPVGEMLVWFRPSLLEALWSGLPPDRVKELFADESRGELAFKEDIARYLAGPDSPFYTLDELQEHVGEFLIWLEENKARLVETGLPCARFPGSGWLNLFAANLYFCKLPCHVTVSPFFSGRRQEYNYAWSRERLDSARHLDEPFIGPGGSQYSRRTRARAAPTFVTYKEAAYAVGISQADGQRIDAERPKLFSIKKAVMERTHQALRDRNTEGLWNDVVAVLRRELTFQDFVFYQNVEFELIDSILGPPMCDPITPGTMPDRMAGGLLALFAVVSHCKAEIHYRGFDRGRRLLQNQPSWDLSRGYYWALLGLPSSQDQARLDKWLGFMARVEVKYRTEYVRDCDQLACAAFRTFRRAGSIPIPSSEAECVQRVRDWAEPIVKSQVQNLEAGGKIMPLTVVRNAEHSALPGLEHNEDFTLVKWYNGNSASWETFTFRHKNQAPAVKLMFKLIVLDELDSFDNQSIRKDGGRLRDWFKGDPAWGKLIKRCTEKGKGNRYYLDLSCPPSLRSP